MQQIEEADAKPAHIEDDTEKQLQLPTDEPLLDHDRQLKLLAQAGGHDLHDSERLVFSDWNEEVWYMERVTLPDREQAQSVIQEELTIDEDYAVEETYMTWAVKPDSEDPWISPDGDEYREAWLECGPDAPGAVPFWKLDPYGFGDGVVLDMDSFNGFLEQSGNGLTV